MDLVSGPDIERRSFEIIDKEAGAHHFTPQEWAVVRRMVHASADFSIMALTKFNAEPIAKGIEAFKRGAFIIVDSTMLQTGISRARLARIHPIYKTGHILCNINDPEVVRLSNEKGLPRSIFNIRSLKDKVDGGVVCIGNAPTALWEVIRLIKEENIVPAVVIGMPVGFVNVVETKEMVQEMNIPYIIIQGRRGGTPLAVAALNAMAILAVQGKQKNETIVKRNLFGDNTYESDNIIGTREPGAKSRRGDGKGRFGLKGKIRF